MQVLFTPMSNFREKSAGYLANHMARLFASGLQRRIQPLGLAPAQFMVLLELWEEDDLTQRDLVARVEVEQATMANTLARMQRDGLIERRPCKDDKRARRICLTNHARSLRDPAIQAARGVNAGALSKLSTAEHAAFVQAMQTVIATLQRKT